MGAPLRMVRCLRRAVLGKLFQVGTLEAAHLQQELDALSSRHLHARLARKACCGLRSQSSSWTWAAVGLCLCTLVATRPLCRACFRKCRREDALALAQQVTQRLRCLLHSAHCGAVPRHTVCDLRSCYPAPFCTCKLQPPHFLGSFCGRSCRCIAQCRCKAALALTRQALLQKLHCYQQEAPAVLVCASRSLLWT